MVKGVTWAWDIWAMEGRTSLFQITSGGGTYQLRLGHRELHCRGDVQTGDVQTGV